VKTPEGYAKAQRALHAHTTKRMIELERLERYADGDQYDGMPHWLDDSVPMMERAPNVVDPIVGLAIESYGDLVLGEGRFPLLTSHPDEDDEPFDGRFGVGPEQGERIDRTIRAILKQGRIVVEAGKALERAQQTGTACCVLSVRMGEIKIDQLASKHTEPLLDPHGNLLAVRCQYPYLEEFFTDGGKRAVRAMIYRRIVDAEADTVWTAEASDNPNDEPQWKEKSRIEHGYGFCPAVWYAYFRRGSEDIDGRAIHALLIDELDELNRSHSQRCRAALYAGDPQMVEIGVDEDHNPAPGGRRARPMMSYPGEHPEAKAAHKNWTMAADAQRGQTRRKGPGIVWRYPASDTRVEVKLLTLPTGALDSIEKSGKDLRTMIADALGWVRIAPDAMRGSAGMFSGISGRTLQWMYRRQLDRCDKIRADFGDGWILPVVQLALRVVLWHASNPSRGALYLSGMATAAGDLSPFLVDVAAHAGEPAEPRWFGPALTLKWGPYFPATEEDQAKISAQVRDDYAAGIITLRTAIERVSEFYNIEDIDAYVDEIEKAKRDRMGDMHAAMSALGPVEDDDEEEAEEESVA